MQDHIDFYNLPNHDKEQFCQNHNLSLFQLPDGVVNSGGKYQQVLTQFSTNCQ